MRISCLFAVVALPLLISGCQIRSSEQKESPGPNELTATFEGLAAPNQFKVALHWKNSHRPFSILRLETGDVQRGETFPLVKAIETAPSFDDAVEVAKVAEGQSGYDDTTTLPAKHYVYFLTDIARTTRFGMVAVTTGFDFEAKTYLPFPGDYYYRIFVRKGEYTYSISPALIAQEIIFDDDVSIRSMKVREGETEYCAVLYIWANRIRGTFRFSGETFQCEWEEGDVKKKKKVNYLSPGFSFIALEKSPQFSVKWGEELESGKNNPQRMHSLFINGAESVDKTHPRFRTVEFVRKSIAGGR